MKIGLLRDQLARKDEQHAIEVDQLKLLFNLEKDGLSNALTQVLSTFCRINLKMQLAETFDYEKSSLVKRALRAERLFHSEKENYQEQIQHLGNQMRDLQAEILVHITFH